MYEATYSIPNGDLDVNYANSENNTNLTNENVNYNVSIIQKNTISRLNNLKKAISTSYIIDYQDLNKVYNN